MWDVCKKGSEECKNSRGGSRRGTRGILHRGLVGRGRKELIGEVACQRKGRGLLENFPGSKFLMCFFSEFSPRFNEFCQQYAFLWDKKTVISN